MAVTQKITLSIGSELENVGLIGQAVNQICRSIPLSEVESYQAELCVVEAVTNCIEHAYRGQVGHLVHVDIIINSERVSFKVRDTGITMQQLVKNPTLEFDPENVDELPEGGMGLFIIHEVMDDVLYGHQDGENSMFFAKTLRQMAV